jgi:hypothetical protein
LIEVPANDPKFFFSYFLYVPNGVPRNTAVRLLVEPNNTGTTDDRIEVHEQSARQLASQGLPRELADSLTIPLLVPVFPRPKSQGDIYTQALTRRALCVKDAKLVRVDLQLLGMIQHAHEVLKQLGILTKHRVLMDGFSASACFVNRFAALHPDAVRALTAGGINALPLLPLKTLPYPLGVADLNTIPDTTFKEESYRRVSQYIYMGSLDPNDTFSYSDSWDDNERKLIETHFGRQMMPERWNRSQEIISTLDFPIQTVTYSGVCHQILVEMRDDIIAFLKANEGEVPATIKPHEYPVVPFREIHEAHVQKLYWNNDSDLPERYVPSPGEYTFVIAIDDWIKDQCKWIGLDECRTQYLQAFVEKAGFDFELVSNGRATIPIGREAFCGTTSYNNGEFQGFYVCLNSVLASQVTAGVPYCLRPKKTSDAFFWTVPANVVLLRRDRPLR